MLHFLKKRRKVNPSMKYFVNEIDATAQGQFSAIPDETWDIGSKCIDTPHGSLKVKKYLIVCNGPMVGIQFEVTGILDLTSLCKDLKQENITTFALMRQPHNVWLWGYAFDRNHQPIVNFCGHDELDGLARFITEIECKY